MIKNNIFKKIRYTLYISFIMGFMIFYTLLVNPIIFGVSKNSTYNGVSEINLKNHVSFLVGTEKERNYKEINTLNAVSEYIFQHFEKYGCDRVYLQNFNVRDLDYKNIICSFYSKSDEKIVVGAHYDVDSDNVFKVENDEITEYFQGADDNASGVAGVLELARVIGKNKTNLKNNIELVAYSLEEMPFFATEQMGSYVHAKSLYDKNEKIKYMISLEMIGYFTDEKIQTYPVGFLNWFYPSRGNFIAIVGKIFDNNIKDLKIKMISNSDIDIVSLSSPSFVGGIGLSDHRNYWNFGYQAYMITDTSFFRNKYYHTSEDTIDKLDFKMMKEVVSGVYGFLK